MLFSYEQMLKFLLVLTTKFEITLHSYSGPDQKNNILSSQGSAFIR